LTTTILWLYKRVGQIRLNKEKNNRIKELEGEFAYSEIKKKVEQKW
jgi:hypothetical protein